MPTSADLLFDTSAAIALVRDADPAHESVMDAAAGLTLGLAGHARFETYSVLTRLPGSARISAPLALEVIERSFPASVSLPPNAVSNAVAEFAASGIAGGAVYDGLVGLAARSAGIPLLSCDRRAASTYARLRVDVRFL